MTAFGVPYLNVCLNCRDEFAAIEGNEQGEFCSYDCEDEYWRKENQFEELAVDTAAEVYQQDYGKAPPWLRQK